MRPLILALDVTGHPSEWIAWQEAITYQATDRVAREMGGHEFTLTGGVSRSAGTVSAITASSIALKGRDPLGWKPILPNVLPFFRDRCICACCGRQGESRGHARRTRDHIIPLPQGRPDQRTNRVTACKFPRPKSLLVRCVCVWKVLKTRVSELYRTSVDYQFARPANLRAGYPSGAFAMGSQLCTTL